MCTGGGGGKSDDSYEREQARRAAAVKEGMGLIEGQFAGFDDNFYKQRQNDYLEYAMPQIDEQFADAQKQLIYALSRSGLTNSSAGAEELAGLQKQRGKQTRAAVDRGRAVANQARTDVANQKSDLVAQLQTTYDPATALSGARSRSTALQSAPTYEPLSTLFTLPAQLVGDAIAQSKYNKGYGAGSGATLFASPTQGNAVTVVG